MFLQQGRNKKIIFLIHFDVSFEDFNHMVQTGYPNLVVHHALPQPQAPPNPPLQPHPSIVNFHEPPMYPTNHGWENNPINPPFRIAHYPSNPFPPPHPLHSMPYVSFASSMNRSIQITRN
jgi:hypothetical protein